MLLKIHKLKSTEAKLRIHTRIISIICSLWIRKLFCQILKSVLVEGDETSNWLCIVTFSLLFYRCIARFIHLLILFDFAHKTTQRYFVFKNQNKEREKKKRSPDFDSMPNLHYPYTHFGLIYKCQLITI